MNAFRFYMAVILASFVGVLALTFALPARAAPLCIPVENMMEVVAKQGYIVVWTGAGGSGETYSIISDKKGEKWAAVVIDAATTKACFVAEGPKNRVLGSGV